jgi:hypothetical protein
MKRTKRNPFTHNVVTGEPRVEPAWREEAIRFIQDQKWNVDADKFDELVIVTGSYLKRAAGLLRAGKMSYPCYVVHNQDNDFRFESRTERAAMSLFKEAIKHDDRVGLFYYDVHGRQQRLKASVGYSLTRDFPPMEE